MVRREVLGALTPDRKELKTRIAMRHLRAIRRSIKATVSIDQILDEWFHLHPEEAANTTISTQMARDWAKFNVRIVDTERLNLALGQTIADGYILGQDVTAYEIARKLRLGKATNRERIARSLSINWDDWKPGNRAAAALVSPPGGLQRLLDKRGLIINGINRTTLNRIGTQLADGLNAGDSRKQMAERLRPVIDDSERAMMIAGTEMSAATVQASLDLYRDSGVEMVEWLVADPCDLCSENLAQSPIEIGQQWINGDPPVHPNCMCDIAPYVVDTALAGWLNQE